MLWRHRYHDVETTLRCRTTRNGRFSTLFNWKSIIVGYEGVHGSSYPWTIEPVSERVSSMSFICFSSVNLHKLRYMPPRNHLISPLPSQRCLRIFAHSHILGLSCFSLAVILHEQFQPCRCNTNRSIVHSRSVARPCRSRRPLRSSFSLAIFDPLL